MSASSALGRGRAAAESLMLDECAVTRPGEPVTDPDTGEVTTPSVLVYAGRCKVQSKDSSVSSPEAGGHSFTVVSRQVHIPAESADVRDGDVITITAARTPQLVGKVYRVDGFTPDSFDTAFRLPVKEVTS